MCTSHPDRDEVCLDAFALLTVTPGELADEGVRRHVRDLHRLRAVLDAAIVEATGVLDGRMIWAGDAARSAGAWLAARVDAMPGAARHEVRLARDLRDAPVVAEAARTGRLGRVKVDALMEVRTPELIEVFAEQEAYLVEEVAALRADEARRFLQSWQQFARLAIDSVDPDGPPPGEAPRVAVNLAQTFQGRYVLDGEMDPEHGAIVRSVIDAEVDDMFRTGVFGPDDGLTPPERRGQALVQVLVRKGRVGIKNGEIRPSIEVIVDERTLLDIPIEDDADQQSRVCQTRDGTPIPVPTMQRLLCEAVLHRVLVNAKSEVLDLGLDVRLANRAQRRALAFLHRGCQFPGCSAPASWCEAHHIEPYDPSNKTGPTDLANLCLLCRFHHHRVHEGRFHLARGPNGTLQVHRPDGTPIDRCRPRRPTIKPTRPDRSRPTTP
ncbi:MAG TPA: DUF222 domain-containing protein [Acidimicrobiales bacterium]|nr:DUF222 domain-containing protein [Acidimicrobiales bacterium]